MNDNTKTAAPLQGKLLSILYGWTGFFMILTWLPLIRILMDGASYSWGVQYFGLQFYAEGIGPDMWVLVVQLIIGGGLLWTASRMKRKFLRPLLLIWLGFLAFDALFSVLRGDEMMFHGDTLNIHLNVTWIFLALHGGFFLLSLIWAWRDREMDVAGVYPSHNRRTKICAILAALIVPAQIPLLAFGEPHATTDEIGVILTMIQWALIVIALYPADGFKFIRKSGRQ